MWLTSDRRVNVVAIAGGSDSMFALQAHLHGLAEDRLRSLDDDLESLQWDIADALESMSFDAGVEEPFVARPLPDEMLNTLNWDRLLGADMKSEFDQIELRWRLDVLGVVQQEIANIEAIR